MNPVHVEPTEVVVLVLVNQDIEVLGTVLTCVKSIKEGRGHAGKERTATDANGREQRNRRGHVTVIAHHNGHRHI